MTPQRLFPLASGTGVATVIRGNIVILSSRGTRTDALVQAFTNDANTQFQSFDTAQEAAEWAAQTALSHQGSIQYWEVRGAHSITISRGEYGRYRPQRHPIWVDSDHIPVMGLTETFPNQEDALEWIRNVVDEEARQEEEYQAKLQRIHEALATIHRQQNTES